MYAKATQPRRERVKSRRGIYFRTAADGQRRYEVTYTDSTGRQRWQTVPGGLRDAEAALEGIRSRKRRGERIAPSKATVADVASLWLAAQGQLGKRTRETYESHLRVHALPRLGRLKIGEVTADDVAELVTSMLHEGSSPWTVRATLTPLSRVFGYAARRGLIASNPVRRLEKGERPRVERRAMRILSSEEIGRLLDAASPKYHALLSTALFSGLRQGELLGLVWADVDLDAGLLRVRRQLDRDGERAKPKTPGAIRDVVLMPTLGTMLREHRLASPFAGEDDPVFASETGTPLQHRNVSQRGLEPAMRRAGLNGNGPKLRFHDLRHCFASMLIAMGANVVFVSKQLGHARTSITTDVYGSLFDRREQADRTRDALETAFGKLLESTGGEQRQNGSVEQRGEVIDLQAYRH